MRGFWWKTWLAVALLQMIAGGPGTLRAEDAKKFVGAEVCKDCHASEYKLFKTHCKKFKSFEHVKLMQKGLREDEFRSCLECHTTGYGRPGGFVSEKETPNLQYAGCEVCHGPGSAHVESQQAKDIKGRVTMADCEKCHNPDRVEAFNFKPLVHGGAH